MVWYNNKLSFSSLNSFRSCPASFDLNMSTVQSVQNDNMRKGSEFGIMSEKVWDKILLDRWTSKPESEVESLLLTELKLMSVEDAQKFEKGFLRAFVLLRSLLPPNYVVTTQDALSFDQYGMVQYGKLDYLVKCPDTGRVMIIDAKAVAQRKPSIGAQLLHYAYMYVCQHKEIPETYALYTRLGAIDPFLFSKEQIVHYAKLFKLQLTDIQKKRKQDLEHYLPYIANSSLKGSLTLKRLVGIVDSIKKCNLPTYLTKYDEYVVGTPELGLIIKELSNIPASTAYDAVYDSSGCFLCSYSHRCPTYQLEVDKKRNPLTYAEKSLCSEYPMEVYDVDF